MIQKVALNSPPICKYSCSYDKGTVIQQLLLGRYEARKREHAQFDSYKWEHHVDIDTALFSTVGRGTINGVLTITSSLFMV